MENDTYHGAKNSIKIASCSTTRSSKSGPDKSKTSLPNAKASELSIENKINSFILMLATKCSRFKCL